MDARTAVLTAAFPPYYRLVGATPSFDLESKDDFARMGCSYYPDLLSPAAPPLLDAILTRASTVDLSAWAVALRRLRLRLHRHGALYVFIDRGGPSVEPILAALEPLGLGYYRGWQWEESPGVQPRPLTSFYEGADSALLLRFQRFTYDPVAHAREHLRDMGFGFALAVLNDVPEHWYTHDEARGLHEAERLVCLLAQDRHAGPSLRMLHFVTALHAYNRACTLVPLHEPAYQCMAAFWRGIGRPDMARRLMTTLEAILPTPAGAESLARQVGSGPKDVSYSYPDYDPGEPPCLLMLCHPESDYGADVLFDGLRRVLGADRVIGYPWKTTLHGQDPDAAFGYPCTFDWRDGPLPLPQLEAEAREGGFDAILYCDVHGTLPREATQRLLQAAGDTPLFILDTWDECANLQDIIRARDGLKHVAGYFKREMLLGLDYGPHAWPLPFAYPEERFPDEPFEQERAGIFWAGKLIGGARRLQLSWLTPQVPIAGAWGTPYSQADYVALLRNQAMGLCFFGNGFDTVRYWELPAHGVMLLAERSPLVIPHNFKDDVHGVFFDHALELLDKARHYLAHPEEAEAIARGGHAHARAYHTGKVRARQCLGVIQQRLRELRA